jgi:hypothetical protein
VESSKGVVAFLDALAQISPVSAFIRDHGVLMEEFSSEHAEFRRGKLGDCYMNAGRVVYDRPDLRYVEGYAVPGNIGIPLMHAWLVDEDGRVIDPTWADGAAYYGVIIPKDVYSACLMGLGYWGIFDNLWMKPGLLDLIKEAVACPTTA